jgi:hypothetical protein
MMGQTDIIKNRLFNQKLSHPDFETPEEAAHWFGAVQAQDYLGSLWAVGQRVHNATEKVIEEAINKRKIVRSWPMRGTLHFTHAQDLHWMLKLLAPRVVKRNAFRYRELELTEENFTKSSKVLTKALVGGKELTREAMLNVLAENDISPAGQRGIHILGKLAMEGLLCFGSRNGKQFTFTLLDEWIPPSKIIDGDEALAELTKRYFLSHGPATIKDFAWWSGLTVAEIKRGIALTTSYLHHETIDDREYWFGERNKAQTQKPKAHLLPAYDEYTVAYKDRSAIIESNHFIQAGNGLKPTIVVNGRIIGTWQRELKKHSAILTPHFFQIPNKDEYDLLKHAVEDYGVFLNRTVELRS